MTLKDTIDRTPPSLIIWMKRAFVPILQFQIDARTKNASTDVSTPITDHDGAKRRVRCHHGEDVSAQISDAFFHVNILQFTVMGNRVDVANDFECNKDVLVIKLYLEFRWSAFVSLFGHNRIDAVGTIYCIPVYQLQSPSVSPVYSQTGSLELGHCHVLLFQLFIERTQLGLL